MLSELSWYHLFASEKKWIHLFNKWIHVNLQTNLQICSIVIAQIRDKSVIRELGFFTNDVRDKKKKKKNPWTYTDDMRDYSGWPIHDAYFTSRVKNRDYQITNSIPTHVLINS